MQFSTVPTTASNGVPYPVIFQQQTVYGYYRLRVDKEVGANQQRLQQVGNRLGARHNQVWQSSIVSPLNSDREEHGFDGNKRVLGRKRHIVVDVLGLVLGMLCHWLMLM